MAVLKTQWWRDPKVQAAGWAGMGLHAWSISYCDDNLTDGHVPTTALPTIPGVDKALKAVLDAGLWHPAPGGYQVHKYLDHNRSREKIEAGRDAARARKEKERESRKNGRIHA